MIPYLRIGNLKNHTLSRGTYLYSPYMGVPPPGKHGTDNLQGKIKVFVPLSVMPCNMGEIRVQENVTQENKLGLQLII